MPGRIVVTLDEYPADEIPLAKRACACGEPRDTLVTTTVYTDGKVNPYAGSIQSGCYAYGDLIHQAVLSGAVRGGYTVALEDNVGVESLDDRDPFDGPDKPEHEE